MEISLIVQTKADVTALAATEWQGLYGISAKENGADFFSKSARANKSEVPSTLDA